MPTSSVLLAVAAAVSAMNGSIVCLYMRGISPPPGYGVSRLVGTCECSATQSDSKPACSSAGASSVIEMA